MGQTFSGLIGNRSSPTPTQGVDIALNASAPDPGPAIEATSASDTTPKPTQTISQASISTPEPVSNTRSIESIPHSLFPEKMEDFVREMNYRNGSSGETYEDVSYQEEERITDLIIVHMPDVSRPEQKFSWGITGVYEVKNSFLQGMYDLKKAEYKSRYGEKKVKELTMFHATDADNVDSIIEDNLDWRRVSRGKFGVGVSFSEDPDYCNYYCTWDNGYHRVFIVASVLVCRQTYGKAGMEVPPETYDTAVGNNNLVYVKFNDNEFLPKYLVFYDEPPREKSKYW